jgi:hypothetical protein
MEALLGHGTLNSLEKLDQKKFHTKTTKKITKRMYKQVSLEKRLRNVL